MARCAVCFQPMTEMTVYACTACWAGLTATERFEILTRADIAQRADRRSDMARAPAASSMGTQAPLIDDAAVMARFKLETEDYKALPVMCRMALKEALEMIEAPKLGVGATNMFCVFGTDCDGNTQENLVSAANGDDAIRLFMEYHDIGEGDWDSEPHAYRVPASAPFGLVEWHRVESVGR